MQEAGSTEDVPACFSFGIVFFINAAIWRKTTMEFFNQAITVLQTLVVAIGAGLGVWGVVNLMEGYGNDNPGAKSQGMKQLMSGGGVILIGTQLIPLLSGLFGESTSDRRKTRHCSRIFSRQSKNG